MKLHSMVEIALLGQFFGFGAAAAAAWWPHGLLPGERVSTLPSFFGKYDPCCHKYEIFSLKLFQFFKHQYIKFQFDRVLGVEQGHGSAKCKIKSVSVKQRKSNFFIFSSIFKNNYPTRIIFMCAERSCCFLFIIVKQNSVRLLVLEVLKKMQVPFFYSGFT